MDVDIISNDGKSSSSGSTHSSPPDYTVSDPYIAPSGSRNAPTRNKPHQVHHMETKPSRSASLMGDDERPAVEDLSIIGLKGLIPLTMNVNTGDAGGALPEGFQAPTHFNAPYSIDTDPLLVENTDSNKRAFVGIMQTKVIEAFTTHKELVWKIFTCIVLVGYTLYLGFSISYSPYGAIAPCVFTAFGVVIWFYYFVKKRWGKAINRNVLVPYLKWWDGNWYILKWFVWPAPLLTVVIVLTFTITDVKQLQSLSGFIFFFFLMWITSKHPNKVVWRPVLWGYTLQFVMGMMVLQWEYGYMAVEWLASYVTKVINFGYQGSAIIWGDPFMVLHPFVMMGMSLLIYIGAVMAIFYYLGVTQLAASKLAWAMSACLGTTAIETLGVASNIMLNGMDVLMMLRPYLMKLTMSEFNAFMVGNNATIAGFMFGLLILFGAPPQHLLTAAVMSSPAAMAIAKLNWPETVPERSITRDMNEVRLSRGTEKNMVEAAANGSAIAGRTAVTVAVNYISFMSILAFIDATLGWAGGMIGYPQITFDWICSYVFYPIPLLIGVELNQCREVAKVIGLKIFTTEIYSYQVLGQLYDQGVIDERSKALGTYALCGFCSLSTLAIAVGIWAVICPPRRPLVSRLMIRVMFEANVACFTTACIAGLFYSENLQVFDSAESTPGQKFITWWLGTIPKLLD